MKCDLCAAQKAFESPTFLVALCHDCWKKCCGHALWNGRNAKGQKCAQSKESEGKVGALEVLHLVRDDLAA